MKKYLCKLMMIMMIVCISMGTMYYKVSSSSHKSSTHISAIKSSRTKGYLVPKPNRFNVHYRVDSTGCRVLEHDPVVYKIIDIVIIFISIIGIIFVAKYYNPHVIIIRNWWKK